jgi:hypothetical protein
MLTHEHETGRALQLSQSGIDKWHSRCIGTDQGVLTAPMGVAQRRAREAAGHGVADSGDAK